MTDVILAGPAGQADPFRRAAAALAASGLAVATGARGPVILDDPETLWIVESGRVDVYAIEPLPDGSVYAGGIFTHFDGALHAGILRLLPDGTADPGFVTGTGLSPPNAGLIVIEPAADDSGDIYIGGQFTHYDGHPSESVARLHSDGTFDAGFVSRFPSGSTIYDIVPVRDVPCKAVSMKRRSAFVTLTRDARFGLIRLTTLPSGSTTALATRGSHSVPPLDSAA